MNITGMSLVTKSGDLNRAQTTKLVDLCVKEKRQILITQVG